MLDDHLAAPAGVAAGKVGLAVAIAVEQLGDFRLLEVRDILDVVLVGGLLVDHEALQHAWHHVTGLDHGVVAAGLVIEGLVHVFPHVHGEVGVAIGQRQEQRRVVGFLGGLDVVAQRLEAGYGDLAAKAFFGDGGEDRRDFHPGAGLVGASGMDGAAQGQTQEGSGEAGHERFLACGKIHGAPVVVS